MTRTIVTQLARELFRASFFFLGMTMLLEWWHPGFVVLFIPIYWMLGVILVSGCAVAFLGEP